MSQNLTNYRFIWRNSRFLFKNLPTIRQNFFLINLLENFDELIFWQIKIFDE